VIALDRELVQRFAPSQNRPALAALFSIEKEVLDTLRPGLEHTVSHAKLGWWSNELERLALGQPAHPATVALARAAEDRGRSPPDLRALAEHASVALACIAFVERAELDAHLRHWASSVFRELSLLGAATADDPRHLPIAERLAARAGPAVREVELLFAFELHAPIGRVYTPIEPDHVATWTARPLGDQPRHRLNDRLMQLDVELDAAVAEVPRPARTTLASSIVWARLAQRTACLARGAAGLQGDLGRIEPMRRTIRAWRIAVRALHGAS
jgi:phytoene synthase